MIKVIVTELEYKKAEDIFNNTMGIMCIPSAADEETLAKTVIKNQAKYAIVGVNKYSGKLYDAIGSGGLIARFGVGYDGLDFVKAKEHGVFCTNTPGALDDSVAECTIGLLLSSARHIPFCVAQNKNGLWDNRVGMDLSGKTLSIIGCGKIGCRVARMAKQGFNMKVIGCNPTTTGTFDFFDEITDDFSCAVKHADFISLHIPDIMETKDFINSERLQMMKATAILINTSRGGVVDEVALYDALNNSHIGGAALDVFKCEPYKPMSPKKDLRNLDTVIMTPHIGSSTKEACRRMAKISLQDIMLFHEGKTEEIHSIGLTSGLGL